MAEQPFFNVFLDLIAARLPHRQDAKTKSADIHHQYHFYAALIYRDPTYIVSAYSQINI
jgi:hypothetical protein